MSGGKHDKRNSFAIWAVMGILAAFFFWNEAVREGVRDGLSLCACAIIPALFPFSVGTYLMLSLGFGEIAEKGLGKCFSQIFHLPGNVAAPFLLGLVGGYPLGAYAVSELRQNGSLTKEEAEKAACFCCNAGPAFILGVVGAGVFGSMRIGILLYLIHAVSALICGILLRTEEKARSFVIVRHTEQHLSLSSLLASSIGKSVQSMLSIAGAVVLFSGITAVLRAALPLDALPPLFFSLLYGSLELSGGCCSLIGCEQGSAFLISSALLGWGGFCVHLQAMETFSKAGITPLPYLYGKTLQAVVSFLLALPFVRILSANLSFPVLPFASVCLIFVFFSFFKNRGGNPERTCYNGTR